MSKARVIILDDNRDFLESTAWMLEGLDYIVQAFDDPEQAIACMADIAADTPCCLLLDIRMPEMSGLDVHDRLLERGLLLPVIYMTGHGDVALAVNAMQKGAVTFLEKPLDDTRIAAAIDLALSAECQRRRRLPDDREQALQTRRNMASLTPRETEILDHILVDRTNKEIARAMLISLKTVEMHRSRVMKKLDVRSAAQLVRLVCSYRDV